MARGWDKGKQANYIVCCLAPGVEFYGVIEGLFASKPAPTRERISNVGAGLLAKVPAPTHSLAIKRKKPRHNDRAFTCSFQLETNS